MYKTYQEGEKYGPPTENNNLIDPVFKEIQTADLLIKGVKPSVLSVLEEVKGTISRKLRDSRPLMYKQISSKLL